MNLVFLSDFYLWVCYMLLYERYKQAKEEVLAYIVVTICKRITVCNFQCTVVAKWKLVYIGNNHLGIYVCRKVDDWEGTTSCESSAGVLYVLERADGGESQNADPESELEHLLDGTCLSWSHQKNLTGVWNNIQIF